MKARKLTASLRLTVFVNPGSSSEEVLATSPTRSFTILKYLSRQGRNWFQKVGGDNGVGGERSEPIQLVCVWGGGGL